MMIRWWEHSQKSVTDGRTENTIHKAAWSQLNPQTARILTSHKGPAQVISHLYICNNQFDITYHVWFNKYKTKNDQYKWIGVELDCTFFINDTKAMYASKAQVGSLCAFQILAIWV